MGLDTHWVDAAALRRRHPGIGPAARGALLAVRDGAVNNVALTAALLARAFALGVTLVHDEACEITARRGRVSGVNGATTSYPADGVVLAAGAWSGSIAGLPRAIAVEPVRGQMAALPWRPDHYLLSFHGIPVKYGAGSACALARASMAARTSAIGSSRIV